MLSAAPDEAGIPAEPRGDGGERSPERSPAERREDERSPEEDEDEEGGGSVRPPRRRPYCLVLHGHGPQVGAAGGGGRLSPYTALPHNLPYIPAP